MRTARLSEQEKTSLRTRAGYEGSPHHKRKPGDFGLTPPAAPRLDKTLCDEAGVFERARADDLFARAIERGVVSEANEAGIPKQIWVVDERGRVFEAMRGGSRPGRFHGYPIRKSDPLHDAIVAAWEDDNDAAD